MTGPNANLVASGPLRTGNRSRLGGLLQCGNSLFERRMRHEELLPALRRAAADAEGRHLLRQRGRGVNALEGLEGTDHRRRTGQPGTTGVGAELTLAREPGHDHAREDAKHELRDDDRDHVARARAALVLEDDAVDDEPDDA